jgi:hypothetical protein
MVAKPILEIGDVSRMGSSPITPITFKNRDFNFKQIIRSDQRISKH